MNHQFLRDNGVYIRVKSALYLILYKDYREYRREGTLYTINKNGVNFLEGKQCFTTYAYPIWHLYYTNLDSFHEHQHL